MLCSPSAPSPDAGTVPPYGEAVEFDFEAGAKSLAVADFDSDGRLDLAAATSSGVEIFLGNGQGQVALKVKYPLSWAGASQVIAADLDGDGHQDILGADVGTNVVQLFLGNGDGTFRLGGAVGGFGAGPGPMVVGDFNGDGRPDLAALSFSPNQLVVLLADGAGGFQTSSAFDPGITSPSAPSALLIGDLNSDDKADLVFSSGTSPSYVVLLGQGDGTFLPASTFQVGSSAQLLLLDDVDGDGNQDLFYATSSSVLLCHGNGDGTFQTGATAASGIWALSLALVDVNRDGVVDLVATDSSYEDVAFFLGTGSGAFGPPDQHPLGLNPSCLATGDFDGDGTADFFACTKDAISGIHSGGSTVFGPPSVVPTSGYPDRLGSARFGPAGLPGLVAAPYFNGVVSVLTGRGDGTFSISEFPPGGVRCLATDDFNQDGLVDVVVGSGSFQGVGILALEPDGGSAGFWTESTNQPPESLATADFNEDGLPDVVVAGDNSGQLLLLGQPGGTLANPISISVSPWPSGGYGFGLVVAGDFNGDGHADLAFTSPVYGATSILVGDGTGAFQTFSTSFSVGVNVLSLHAADLDGDGWDDLLSSYATCCYPVGRVTAYFSNGDGTFRQGGTFKVPREPASMALDDLDGDAVPDLVVAGYGGHSVAFLHGDGSGLFEPAVALFKGYSVSGVAVGDFNLDCLPDLSIVGSGSAGVEVYFRR